MAVMIVAFVESACVHTRLWRGGVSYPVLLVMVGASGKRNKGG